jgi:PAS domain S-box-containing protein
MDTHPNIPAPADTYRDLFEDAPIAYHELGPDGTILRVNAAESALLGYSVEEMLGRPIWDFIAGEEVVDGHACLARKLSGRQPLAPFLRQYVRRDNRYITVEIRDRLIRNASGEVIGIRSALIDVTDRVAAEHARHESEQGLRTILRSLRDPIIATDSLGYVKFQTPLAQALTGWSETEAIGKDVDEVVRFHTRDTGGPGQRVSLGGLVGTFVKGEWQGAGYVLDGEDRPVDVLVSAAPILSTDGVVIGVVFILRRRSLAPPPDTGGPACGWAEASEVSR